MQNIISFLFYLSLILCLVYIGILFIYSFLLQKIISGPNIIPDKLPSVSVLVAARNEDQNIIDCLQALNNMQYTEGQIEIFMQLVHKNSENELVGHLKSIVPEFISNNKNLMKIIYEMKDAKIEDGGSGAFYIFLKKNKSIK